MIGALEYPTDFGLVSIFLFGLAFYVINDFVCANCDITIYHKKKYFGWKVTFLTWNIFNWAV